MLGLCLCVAVLAGGGFSATHAQNARTDEQASGYFDVGGARIYYEARGSGRTIVLLHDGLLASPTWDEIWEPLAKSHQVIRYDRRGYGRSEAPTKPYSPTEDLQKLLAHLRVEHAIIAGSSSGGALVIDFAIAHPEMVDGLFLIGPVLHGLEYSAAFRDRANRNNAPMERGDVKAWATNWAQDRFVIAGVNESARRKIYDQLVENAEKLKNYDSALEEKLSPPASERLSAIKAPALILVGEADIADVRAHCDAIKAGIHGSKHIVVKGAGHLIQLEKPDEVLKRLEEFTSGRERQTIEPK